MWVKKTPDELKEKHTAKRLQTFLVFFILIFLLLFLGTKYFGEMGGSRSGPTGQLTWKEAIEKIPGFLLLSFIITLITTQLDFANKKKTKPTYLCNKCNRYKKDNDGDLCECSGRFVNIDTMKWVDDENNL